MNCGKNCGLELWYLGSIPRKLGTFDCLYKVFLYLDAARKYTHCSYHISGLVKLWPAEAIYPACAPLTAPPLAPLQASNIGAAKPQGSSDKAPGGSSWSS